MNKLSYPEWEPIPDFGHSYGEHREHGSGVITSLYYHIKNRWIFGEHIVSEFTVGLNGWQ